jgi:hypothetical protein
MQTIPQIIEQLGGPSRLAREMGLPVATVSAWKHRSRIPARHWPDLVSLARHKRLKGISLDVFFQIDREAAAA